jgi:recombinational DNA repair protein (RecF pathway)
VHGKTGWKVVSARATKNFFELLKNSPTKLHIVSNVLNLLKKLAPEEESASPLFSIISHFLTFSLEAKEEDLPLAECLILLRILHSLGYMRYDPDFSIPLSSSEIQKSDLDTIAPKRMRMVHLINESLKATQL